MSKLRILLVGEGLAPLLPGAPDLEVVGRGNADVLSQVEELAPHVLVVAWPESMSLDSVRALKRVHPNLAVVVLSADESPASLVRVLRAGASGYVLKSANSLLVSAIRFLREGVALVPQDLLCRAWRAAEPYGGTPLTEGEREVLHLMAQGLTYQQMANHLCLAHVSVNKRLQSLRVKLGARTRVHAVMQAVRLGLLEP